MIQKALYRNELVGTRFMVSKPNEVAREHNNGIPCSNGLKLAHIGASSFTADECLHWVYLNMFSITCLFFVVSSKYRDFL